MDLSNLVTQNNAEEGKWFRVVLYGERQNFWLNLIGADSDRVQKHNREQFKKLKNAQNNKNNITDAVLDEMLDSGIDSIVLKINGICGGVLDEETGDYKMDKKEPVTILDRTLGNDETSYRFLLEKIPALKQFINEITNERSNFLD